MNLPLFKSMQLLLAQVKISIPPPIRQAMRVWVIVQMLRLILHRMNLPLFKSIQLLLAQVKISILPLMWEVMILCLCHRQISRMILYWIILLIIHLILFHYKIKPIALHLTGLSKRRSSKGETLQILKRWTQQRRFQQIWPFLIPQLRLLVCKHKTHLRNIKINQELIQIILLLILVFLTPHIHKT